MKSTHPHRITVALRMAGIAGQDKLNGIFNYLSEGNRWQLSIYRTAHEFTAETVRHEIEHGTAGFIVGIPDATDALSALAQSDIPTIVMNVSGGNIEKRVRNIAFVKSDSAAIGQTAARELLKQGVYKCYGYAGYRVDESWSRERGRAFRDTLEKAGHLGRMFDFVHFADKLEDRDTMIRWLKELPKPCGILASCDDRAFEILDACRDANIRVPAEIGLLGINNDPILCENSEPRLSSVQPDFIREGRLAAELLGRMLASKSHRPCGKTHLVGVRQVVHRDTTLPMSEAGLLVQKALAYIEKNAVKGIGVQDVARHLKVSYSLLNLRFQGLQHQPVYDAILQKRLDAVKSLLRNSTEPLDAIAGKCGWSNPASLKKLFKQRFKISMRDYRTQ